MHLYALYNTVLISAACAQKRINYICPECLNIVRCRSGNKKQPHFYHIYKNRFCRQSGKSKGHLQTQLRLQAMIPTIHLEKKIGSRIADALWDEEKIVFEIQYSPLSLEEAKNRCKEYEKNGYTVVWILHDKQFNKKKTSPSEYFLRKEKIAFFTNGHLLYDQIEICTEKIRVFKGKPRPINITKPTHVTPFRCSFPGEAFRLQNNQTSTWIKKRKLHYKIKGPLYLFFKRFIHRLLELTTT
jgi:competence protein CoiA